MNLWFSYGLTSISRLSFSERFELGYALCLLIWGLMGFHGLVRKWKKMSRNSTKKWQNRKKWKTKTKTSKQANKQWIEPDKTDDSSKSISKKFASKLLWCLSNKLQLTQEKNQVSFTTTYHDPLNLHTYILKEFLNPWWGFIWSKGHPVFLSLPEITIIIANAPISVNKICLSM